MPVGSAIVTRTTAGRVAIERRRLHIEAGQYETRFLARVLRNS
jgi:hypothetical protein